MMTSSRTNFLDSHHTDIVIIGGGLAGLTLALALQDCDYRVTILEAQTSTAQAQADSRALALSYGSRLLLERLGIWQELERETTAIETVHVAQSPEKETCLTQAEMDVPALGYVTHFGVLHRVLNEKMTALLQADSHFTCVRGARVSAVKPTRGYAVIEYDTEKGKIQLTTRLVIFADGGKSAADYLHIPYQHYDYQQSAILTVLESEKAHFGHAFECFTPSGPLALLPFGGTPKAQAVHLVWTLPPNEAEALAAASSEAFLARLNQHALCPAQLGQFTAMHPARVYPLALRYAEKITAPRSVLISNAAQMLHPVAGQGFNLGLRDIFCLAQVIQQTDKQQLGETEMLRQYEKTRYWDRTALIKITDGMVRLFSNDSPFLTFGRDMGLTLFNLLPPARHAFMRKMVYGIR